MRHNLNRPPKKIPAPLLLYYGIVNLSGCEIAVTAGRYTCKALVVPEIQISLGTIVCHIYLPMLVGVSWYQDLH